MSEIVKGPRIPRPVARGDCDNCGHNKSEVKGDRWCVCPRYCNGESKSEWRPRN